jgi:DNA invertase Pin-like site-specific DNA recombinase
MQRTAIQRAAKARGDRIREWFQERESARVLDRPELGRLREAARAGRVSKLYVYRLDRLARSGIRDTLSLLEELKLAGCAVETIADGFTMGGPAHDVVVAVLAWAAQMERLAIGERISDARARARAQGKHWGRRRAVGAAAVQKIRKLVGSGVSIRSIAQQLKVPRSTVADVVAEKGPYSTGR